MKTLINNSRIFDGHSEQLIENMSVLIEDGKIARIAPGLQAPEGANIIDARGKTLMPGLIDAHWHSIFHYWPVSKVLNADLGHLEIYGAKAAEKTLLRGFTTVRDLGGNCFGIVKATDDGAIDGPRVYPCGGFITQTSGHGDFRSPLDVPSNPGAPLDYFSRVGHTLIADGVPEVMRRTREVLRMGATQIKLMAGGGVASLYDPLDVTQYTFEETKAVVDVAKTWNTYVAIHVNTEAAILQALEAGVLSIEHGMFIKDEAARVMAEKGAWWSMQPIMNDEDALKFESEISTKKFEQCVAGLEDAIAATKKYKVKTAFGTDSLFDMAQANKQGKLLAKLKRWYTPFEALKMATSDNAQLLKLCGPRDPYPGALGEVREGAHADLLLVNGNPLENLDLVANPDENFLMIMKNGKVYKSTLGDFNAK